MKHAWSFSIVLFSAVLLSLAGCSPDSETGFQDEHSKTSVSPQIIASGLNFPWGLEFITNPDVDGTGEGSVLPRGQLLVANRGIAGGYAHSVVRVDPIAGSIAVYSDQARRDRRGWPATDSPMDVAFWGSFAWIANDAGGLGTIAATDPNPSRQPNGPTGSPGDPVDGPTGTGVFGSDDFGFVVMSINPEEYDENVSLNNKIEVVFSQSVDPNTITSSTFKVEVHASDLTPDPPDPRGRFLFSDDYTRVEFDYEGSLYESTTYRITLDSDITNQSGVELDGNLDSPGPDDFVSYFSTGSGNPRVVWVDPGNGATQVPVDTDIEVGFSEPIRNTSVTTSSFYVLDSEGDRIDAEVTVYPDKTRAILVPDTNLNLNQSYTVHVTTRVVDLAGNPLDQQPGGYPDAFMSAFSTGAADTSAPRVTQITPANGAPNVDSRPTITAVFSEPIAPSSRIGQYFLLTGPAGQISGAVSWNSDTELQFIPAYDLPESGTFTITISDVLTDMTNLSLDGNGDGFAGGNFSSVFSTGSEGLYVISSYPADGNAGISISTIVYVNFSKAVNPSTINTQTFTLARESMPDQPIPATVFANQGNMGATLRPDAYLSEDTAYIIRVSSEVTDPAGNPLDQIPGLPLDAFSARFVTGGEDNTPPCIISIQPTDGATGITVSTTVTATFGEPINPASVTPATFTVTGPGGTIPGDISFTQGNAAIVFTPSADLEASQTYTIRVTTGVVDTSGNALDGDCNGTTGPDFTSSFTTGVGGVVINEAVVDPQQDWSDSEGGDGIAFNNTPGTGSITTSDEWIELYNASNQSLDITNWKLEMVDTSPETHVIGSGSGTEVYYPASSTSSNFQPGSYLIIGNPVGSNNNSCYFILKDAQDRVIDDVEIGDDLEGDGEGDGAPEAGEDGGATGVNDEAIARSPNAFDSENDIADFVKQEATIGRDNSASKSGMASRGRMSSDTILEGMSGIVAAGIAPDDPSPYNYLYFATQTRREIVYAIDFDDGIYHVLTGIESPRGLEFIQDRDESGNPLPGQGWLYVLNPEDGNLLRARFVPNGPVGAYGTEANVENRGRDAMIYYTYEDLFDPVGIAYSQQHNRLYIACRGNGYILEIDMEGQLTEIFDTGFGMDALGGIAVGDLGSGEVLFLTHTGGPRVDVGSGPNGAIYYFDPHP